jgi:hypothetical protein
MEISRVHRPSLDGHQHALTSVHLAALSQLADVIHRVIVTAIRV